MRTQISTSVSQETRRQANELITTCGYSLRDIITVGIEMLYKSKIQETNVMNTRTIQKFDHISLDGQDRPDFQGEVVQAGAFRSLVAFPAPPESGCITEQMWIDNTRLLVRRRRRENAQGSEPASIELY